ncbi:uncharacterized protein LOC117647399 [Thrips palmi]|uniref:Uncharacterized protein LOC117647399 n=1 Tax=Thrips palmi TaxID=161013 RepID=A0A6P8YY07_THRPL|nr:uncharacterized protein LOC117647399 [Thrips palmi]
MVLPALSAFPTYQQYTIQDSLLPEDSYAALPPEYPLYNWTLPYGPEIDLRSMAVASPASAPSSSSQYLSAPLPRHRPSRPRHRAMGQPEPGIRVQFKSPSEIRRSCAPQDLQQDMHQVAWLEGFDAQPQQRGGSGGSNVAALCPNLQAVETVDLDDEVVEVEVRTCRQDEASASERITFDSIEDALASIEAQTHPTPPPAQGCVAAAAVATAMARSREPRCSPTQNPKLPLADERQDEVVKAAKSLFSKRTRTLYHWLYPDTSKTKLKATVSAAWDTLADSEKQFYLSQASVLGRFGLQASSVMINPQLDGIKGFPSAELSASWTGSAALPTARNPSPSSPSSPRLSEAQEAVNQLFASCADSDTWASYSCSSADTAPAPAAPRPAARTRTLCGHADRRKRPASGMVPMVPDVGPRVRLSALGADHVDEEVTILKEIRDARLEAELQEDAELSSELEKFRLLASGERPVGFSSFRDDFWRGTPDPEDIFTQLDF